MHLLREHTSESLPRERLLKHGVGVLSDAELLALLLRTGHAHKNAVDMAHELLTTFGDLRGVLNATLKQIVEIKGIGLGKASQIIACTAIYERMLHADLHRASCRQSMNGSSIVKHYIHQQLAHSSDEIFAVMFLDNQHRLLHFEEMFKGTINSAPVFPRKIVKRSLELNAAALILAHNHPSGNLVPSSADKQLTKRIKDILDVVDIKLLDHIIVSTEGAISFSEQGMLH